MGCNPITVVNLESLASSDRAKEMFANQRKDLQDNAESYSPSLKQQHDMTLSALESGKSGALELIGWPGHFIGTLVLGCFDTILMCFRLVPGDKGKSYITLILILLRPFSRGTVVSQINQNIATVLLRCNRLLAHIFF